MYCLTILTITLSILTARGQTLNGWRQVTFGIGGTQGHLGDDALDGNPKTYFQDGVPGYLMILLNRADNYKGFYVQSSWPYITDYTITGYNGREGVNVIGQVTGAKSNFTVANFWNAAEQPIARAEWFQIEFTKIFDSHLGVYRNTTNGSRTIVNEIYPIYQDEEIVYPPGHTPQPSPTQTSTRIITQTSLPSHPDLLLNEWPKDIYRHPDIYGGWNGPALVDGDANTSGWQKLVDQGYPAQVSVAFQISTYYAGFYILSDLRDYTITAENMANGLAFEVCRVSGATQELTVCLFTNEAGLPRYNTESFRIHPTAVQHDDTYFNIREIYAIYPGDKIVNQEDL